MVVIVAVVGAALGQQDLDLFEGTLDGVPICGYPLDAATDALGRPSGIDANPIVADIIGPALAYHEDGLELRFNPESKDEDQGAWAINAYLSRTWDEDFSEFFMPFDGALNPVVDANWKASDVEEILVGYTFRIETPEEKRDALAEAGVSTVDTSGFPYSIFVEVGETTVGFHFEPVTQFLEFVNMSCN